MSYDPSRDKLSQSTTLKQLNAFLFILDTLGAYDTPDYTLLEITENPEKYQREYDLCLIYDFLPKGIKAEFIDICKADLADAIMDPKVDDEQMWVLWEDKGYYRPDFC